MNFDSLLEKYKEQGIFKLFYKHNFSISLEDGTNYPAYIIIFHGNHGDPDLIGFTVVMEKEEMKNANMIVDFQLTINNGEISESDSVNGRTLNMATTGPVYGFRHYFDNYHRREEHYDSGWGYSSDFPTEPKIDQLKSMKGKMIFKLKPNPHSKKNSFKDLD